MAEICEAAATVRAPFAWEDGPLVTAMRAGDIILIDELNLAEDAVLERLNRCVRRAIHLLAHPPQPDTQRLPFWLDEND